MIIYDPKITGSFQINGSTISSVESIDSVSGSVVDLKVDSGSFATRVSQAEGSINSLNSASSSYLLNTTDTLDGDLTVTGKITAQEFHTEFVSASIIYQSGSTQFGDSADDTHVFSGSVLINASGSSAPDLKIGPTFNFAGKSNDYLGQIGWNRNVTTGQIFDSNFAAHQIHNYQGNLNHQIYASNGNFVTAHSYDSTGNIGIGIGNGVTPRQRVDVRGKLIFGGTGSSYYGQPGNFDTGSNGDKIVLYSDSGTSYNGTIGVGNVANLWLKSQGESANEGRIDLYTGGNLSLRVDGNGHIGIGTTGIGAKLTFKNEVADRKIALYTVAENNYQFYGFGISNNTLIYHTASTSDDHVFYAGTSSSTRSELMRITGDGNVGIGTTSPGQKFIVHDHASAVNENYINFVRRTGTQSSYDATGFTISAIPTNNTGKSGISFLMLNTRYSALNGNHGTAAFITNTPGIGSTYGDGKIDFFIRNNTAPYTFQNDPVTPNTYWMNSLLSIQSGGEILKPSTPAFLVDGSYSHPGGSWELASSSYTRVKYNIGSNFNTSNGRFTAPVAGRYMFFAGGYSPVGTANKRYAYNVRINSGTIEHITGGTYTGDADSPMAAHSIVVNLNANDYVELWIFSMIAATIGNSSHEAYFGGYLLG